uniref:Myb-like domain-containing protein n=1 Tax=Brassica oleracea var. oleracea TaxID=109376 RepID=A0A0D3E428_BRAOL
MCQTQEWVERRWCQSSRFLSVSVPLLYETSLSLDSFLLIGGSSLLRSIYLGGSSFSDLSLWVAVVGDLSLLAVLSLSIPLVEEWKDGCIKRAEQGSSDKGVHNYTDTVPLPSPEGPKKVDEATTERKERRSWMLTDDIVLISVWLNTSKDPIVGNEQRSIAFWKRIAAYFSASPKVAGSEKIEGSQCKQRWYKLNDLVCKFCGAYEAATRERTSGMNENDVVKLAHEIFFSNYKKRFTLEHAWHELRNDQKWRHMFMSCTGSIDIGLCHGLKDVDDTFDDAFDEVFDQQFDQAFEDLTIQVEQEEQRKRRKKRAYIERNHEEGNVRLWNDYFSETPTYPEHYFRRRFRMNKRLFMHIVHRLSNEVHFFSQRRDGLGRLGLSSLQKCTAAIRALAYGSAADTVDEYLWLGETTTRSCLENFVEGIIYLFGEEYLRKPTPADLQRLLDIGDHRGFPGMIGSIGCMHWEWKNCPTAWKGQYCRGSGTLNDINVLDRSPVFDYIIKGQAPQVTYSVNGREYNLAYYLTDGPKAVLFAQRQEAIRKDVERAFGVLQARFAIVKNPALFWDKVKIGKIMRACIILHNMIVEDERDGYTLFNLSEFLPGEDNGSSHVDLTYSTDIPPNIANMMGVRTKPRDKQMHEQLKADLVEHV